MSDYLPPLSRADGDRALASLGTDPVGNLARVVLVALWAAGGFLADPIEDYSPALDVLWRAHLDTETHLTAANVVQVTSDTFADPFELRDARGDWWSDVVDRLAPFVDVNDSTDDLTALPLAAWTGRGWNA